MLSREAMVEVLDHVSYKNWSFHVEERGDHLFLQCRWMEPDLVTGEIEVQHGRKWILSKHMTPSEVVTTAFKAVLTAEEHEVRERFRYKKRMIFGPHYDVETLYKIATRGHMALRDDPKSVAND